VNKKEPFAAFNDEQLDTLGQALLHVREKSNIDEHHLRVINSIFPSLKQEYLKRGGSKVDRPNLLRPPTRGFDVVKKSR